jgi:RNA polymerase sigma factor (sigma-70 family)
MTDTTTAALRSPSDAELITLARAGDDGAYTELYQRHEGSARAAARSLSRSKADVDDLVAEGFIRVLQALRAGKGPEVAFRPYLLTAIRNAFYDRTRKDKRIEVTDEPPEHVNVQLLDMAMSEDDRALIARAFATLPERWQLVLWHAEVEGQSAAEIGKLLDLAPNAVAALAYRAREGLRQAYLQAHLQREVPERCREPRSQLGGYVRNALASRDRRKVDEHLANCNACSGLLGELDEANNQLRVVLIPLLLGVPAAKYLGGLGLGKGLLSLLRTVKRASRSTQVGAAVGSMAAAASIAVAAVAVSSGGGPAQETAAINRPIPAVSASAAPAVSIADEPTDESTVSTSVPPIASSIAPPAAGAGSEPATATTIAAGGALAIVPTSLPGTSVPPPVSPRPVVPSPRPTTPSAPTTVAPRVLPTTEPTVAPTVAPTTPRPTTSPTIPPTAPPTTVAPPTTTIAPALLPLQVSVTSDLAAVAGQYIYLHVTVDNPQLAAAGSRVASAVSGVTAREPQVVLSVPAGTTLGQFAAGWTCDLENATLRCIGPDVAGGTSQTAAIELRLSDDAPAQFDLAPSVSATGFVSQSTPFSLTVTPANGIEYFRQINGAIASIGNSVMVCVDDGDCADARAGIANGSGNRRHAHQMGYVDIDATTSFNSSMAQLSLPDGASVESALLVWSGDLSPGAGGTAAPDGTRRGTVTITGPSGSQTITATQVDDDGAMYVATADITAAITGSGEYTVANVQTGTGIGRYGGWSIMVAYRDLAAPLSIVAITTNPGSSRAIVGTDHTIGLGAIPTSTSNRSASLTWAVFEGDLSIGNESATLNGVALGAGIAGSELFDSSVGAKRDPQDRNTFGLDIDRFDVTLDADAQELELSITSPNDRLRWGIAGWTMRV